MTVNLLATQVEQKKRKRKPKHTVELSTCRVCFNIHDNIYVVISIGVDLELSALYHGNKNRTNKNYEQKERQNY